MRRLVFVVLLIALSITGVVAQDEGTDQEWVNTLLVTEVFPSPNAQEIATDAVITVIFNRPVVPLVIVEDMDELPQPLAFAPEITGHGEWINTSIYMFRPDTAWSVGTEYTVTVSAGLQATDGTTLEEPYSWSFTTTSPRVVSVNPTDGYDSVQLNRIMQVTFNAPADHASLEANFYLRKLHGTGTVAGTFEWSADDTGFAFTPDELLEMDAVYEAGFPVNSVYDSNRVVTFPRLRWTFATVPYPAIVSTDPYNGESNVRRSGFTIYFASPMDESALPDLITIDPEPWLEPTFYYRSWSDALSVSFPTEPSTEYTITVAPGAADVYGNTIAAGLTFSYTTAPYPPDVSMHVPYMVGFYNAYREPTQLFITHRNISHLNLELYDVPLRSFIRESTNNDLYDYVPSSRDLMRQWQIESEAPENTDRYELLNLTSRFDDPACYNALPARVRVEDSAIVITEPDPLRARTAPVDGEIVDLLYRDYVMPIVGGPICADGLRWWQVELRTGDMAWIAESVDDEYMIDVHTAVQATEVEIPTEEGRNALEPGVYLLQVQAPEVARQGYRPQKHFLVVATANLTVKMSFDRVIVWATDVQSGQPIPNIQVDIYDDATRVIGSGVTDGDGIARIDIPAFQDLYESIMAVVRTDEHFGIGLSNWSEGIDPWRFGQSGTFYRQNYQVYLYTDRPMYRPDQPVYFRGVIRSKDDVTYTPPDRTTVPVQIYDSQGEIVYEQNLPLTEFGTFSDTFTLADDASLGSYRIEVNLSPDRHWPREGASLYFDVAEYRLPEFQVKVSSEQEQVVQGDTISVTVDASYFFGGPVSNANVAYNVAASPYFFTYSVPGKWYDFTDYNFDAGPGEIYGSTDNLVASGQGTTDDFGLFTVEIPAELEDATQSHTFTIEAVVSDESGQAVAGRTSVIVHMGELYIGARPTKYVSTAGQDSDVEFIAVDWDGEPVADQTIDVEVVERRWSSVQEEDPFGRVTWTWEVEEIPVSGGRVETDENGQATYSFVPPKGGTFKVIITTRDGRGNAVRASTFMWVSSREYVSWRQQNSNRIDLVTDGDTYNVGDVAKILIASPFQGETQALVTVERGDVLYTERITMDSNSYVYDLPITEDFAPNVFISVMIVKGVDDTNPVAAFRMGLTSIAVDNSHKELHISITPDTERAGPGDVVTYLLEVTDYAGNPVRAEVGVGLTDLAALSIADPNSGPLLDYFYGPQSLSVRTATALTINTDQITQNLLDTIKGGGGGYGEGGIFDIREEFVDTAYWNAALVTDENGIATFSVTLPDNLTTWRLDARAVTSGADGLTLVGQNTFDILSTKPLLIRPVTPRFFVVGDALRLAAVVNNNTTENLDVSVTLEAYGVTFDDLPDGNLNTQSVSIPADGRARVEWPVTVNLVEDVELIYYVTDDARRYTDASRPPLGQGENRLLPVYRYEAPEYVGTGGVLREAGSRTEAILLPTDFAVTQGELTVDIEPSLAATTLQGLNFLRYYPYYCVEQTVSTFLPNIMTYRALQQTGHEDPKLERELNTAVMLAVQRLYAEQKVDGGWGWFSRDTSNPLTTAYALIGLSEALDAGYPIDTEVIRRAKVYLQSQFIIPGMHVSPWRMNRQAFILYALARSGAPDVARTTLLYEYRDRLSLYAKAMLTTALDMAGDDSGRIDTLISDLLNDVVISANGAYWEEEYRDWWNWNTNTRTTAMVLQTLIRFRPESELIPNVVRWLMVARTADHWETTQETAWAVMALTDWMVASGELQGSYDYLVDVNGDRLLEGTVIPDNITDTQELIIDVADMLRDQANQLVFTRSAGEGNMYYTAYLRAFLPVPEIEPLDRGIILERRYALLGDEEHTPITEAHVGDLVQVRLTIIVPNSLHYVIIEDAIPAGSDAVDPGLRITQQIGTRPGLDSSDPLSRGWGWWWFSNIEFRDEKVVLTATYLPAGTYEYVYTIRPGLPGTYNVIPSVGYEFYFPDVYGRGAGSAFTILPEETE